MAAQGPLERVFPRNSDCHLSFRLFRFEAVSRLSLKLFLKRAAVSPFRRRRRVGLHLLIGVDATAASAGAGPFC